MTDTPAFPGDRAICGNGKPPAAVALDHVPWYTCPMDTKVLPATRDWIFKLLFGDERNKSMLIDMLQSFVELPQEEYELTFMDPHLKPEAEDDKLGILDVRVRTKSGKVINIEIQVDPMRHIGNRLSYYKSKLIAEQIASGDRYDAIQRVICVCITMLSPGWRSTSTAFGFTTRGTGCASREFRRKYTRSNLRRFPWRTTETEYGNG